MGSPTDVRRDGAPQPEPLAAGLDALAARQWDAALTLFTEAGRKYPALGDYVLYYRARALAGARRDSAAFEAIGRLVQTHPDSVWAGRARLLAGELAERNQDPAAARDWLLGARPLLSGARWATATVLLAELAATAGDDQTALSLAREVREKRPKSIADRRARRLVDRIRAASPDRIPWTAIDEAEMRLAEGDSAGARDAAAGALDGADATRARWVVARAERAMGLNAEAEASCRHLVAEAPGDPLAPRALYQAGVWRWNRDDDHGARDLFDEVVARYPASEQVPEALYATGRILQEQGARDPGRYREAAAVYSRLATRAPGDELAPEARWRSGFAYWLAGDFAAADRAFAGFGEESQEGTRIAAEYWRARALTRLGRDDEAKQWLVHLAEEHPQSYYAGLAEAQLGRPEAPATPPADDPPPPFPAELDGPRAERAHLLGTIGFPHLARQELAAMEDDGASRPALVDGYAAVGAYDAAIRLQRTLAPPNTETTEQRRRLYPLGYWPLVRETADARGVDPLLVVSLIRQESLFDAAATSPADAYGLMQLLPSTARRTAHASATPLPPGPIAPALRRPKLNLTLGTAHLAELLARYEGSRPKALAAYNAGQDAVAKWERRYVGREPDEFVELISFRETRDYVKAVLRNVRIYRSLYGQDPALSRGDPGQDPALSRGDPAAPSSPAASSAGSPPNAPFDITASTSPGRAEPSR
jgi:soluble lytic murein transglycosylase